MLNHCTGTYLENSYQWLLIDIFKIILLTIKFNCLQLISLFIPDVSQNKLVLFLCEVFSCQMFK